MRKEMDKVFRILDAIFWKQIWEKQYIKYIEDIQNGFYNMH